MKKLIALLLALTLVLALFVGCSDDSKKPADDGKETIGGEEKTDAPAGNKELKFGVVVATQTLDFFIHAVDGIVDYCKEQGVECVVYSYETDLEKHVSYIDDCITQEVDVIFTSFFDCGAADEALKRAQQAGIPVVTFESTPNNQSLVTCSVVSDDYACGYELGCAMFEKLGGKGQVASYCDQSTSVGIRRYEGFEAALKEYPEIEHVTNLDVNCNSDTDAGMAAVTSMCQLYPELSGYWSYGENTTIVAVPVFQSLGMDVVVTTVDNSQTLLNYCSAGDIYTCLDQQPYLMGQMAAQQAFKVLANEEVETVTYVPVKLIYAEDIG